MTTSEMKKVHIRFTINGEKRDLDIPAGLTALQLIRDVLELKGTKEGCGIGECGACTIVVDGRAVNACLLFAAQLDGRDIMTIEGLSSGDALHPLQETFAEKHAVQCGFCTPGIMMSTHALFQEKSRPDREEIVEAISGNLCRCTGYHSILSAIEEAADHKPGSGDEQ